MKAIDVATFELCTSRVGAPFSRAAAPERSGPHRSRAFCCTLLASVVAFSGCGGERGFGEHESSPSNGEAGGHSQSDAGMEREVSIKRAELKVLYTPPASLFCSGLEPCPGVPTDLDFNPHNPGEMWVVYRQDYGPESPPCDEPAPGQTAPGPAQAGCTLLRSLVAIFSDATQAKPEVSLKEDGNSWHFMRRATALAFGDDNTFATVGEARTGNYLDQPSDFIGPTWWSAEPDVFAQSFFTLDETGAEEPLNGSHLDMLHATPFGMGIAHQRDAVYWAFNGQFGSVDRYDFVRPHEPGGHDHSDGTYQRFLEGELLRVPDVPSHMQFAADERSLLVVDTGHARVIVLDTDTGELDGRVRIADDQIEDPQRVTGAEFEVLVPPGVLELPSGIALVDQDFVVTDNATGLIHRFSGSGQELERLDSGLPAGSLAGVALGPDRKLYFVDMVSAKVLRLERTF